MPRGSSHTSQGHGHGRGGKLDGLTDAFCRSRPNIGLQATANSVRSCLAPAIGGA